MDGWGVIVLTTGTCGICTLTVSDVAEFNGFVEVEELLPSVEEAALLAGDLEDDVLVSLVFLLS